MKTSSLLKLAGGLLLGLSVILIISALTFSTTTSSVSSDFQLSNVHNIGLLQEQMIFLHLGIGCLLAGATFLGFGVLVGQSEEDNPTSESVPRDWEPLPRTWNQYRDQDTLTPDEIESRDEHRRKVAAVLLIIAIVIGVVLIIMKPR